MFPIALLDLIDLYVRVMVSIHLFGRNRVNAELDGRAADGEVPRQVSRSDTETRRFCWQEGESGNNSRRQRAYRPPGHKVDFSQCSFIFGCWVRMKLTTVIRPV